MKIQITLIFIFFSFLVSAQDNLNKKGLALQGYDPVAYFLKEKALKGSKKHQLTYEGATYYFKNKKHKVSFESNPEKYLPEYGGWCAYAMGRDGSKVSINPKTFKILDGKLYLFYNAWGMNTLISWNKEDKTLKEQADKYWFKQIEERE